MTKVLARCRKFYYATILFDSLIWDLMFAKTSLNLLQMSVLSLITLESTMFLSNVLRFVLDLQMFYDFGYSLPSFFNVTFMMTKYLIIVLNFSPPNGFLIYMIKTYKLFFSVLYSTLCLLHRLNFKCIASLVWIDRSIPKDIRLFALCLCLWNFSNLKGKCLFFIVIWFHMADFSCYTSYHISV